MASLSQNVFGNPHSNNLTSLAVEVDLKHIAPIDIKTIHTPVMCLTGWLLDDLLYLCHSNGRPLIQIYGPTDIYIRSATIQLNCYDPDGNLIDSYAIEKIANQVNTSVRAGSHCNPGPLEAAIGLTKTELELYFKDKERTTHDQFITGILYEWEVWDQLRGQAQDDIAKMGAG